MRKADAICVSVLLAIGAIVCYEAIGYGVSGWGAAGPQPGMYPFLLGLGIMVGGVVILGQLYLRSRRGDPNQSFIRSGGLKPVLSVGVPATLMVFLTEFIGLYLAAGLYLAVYMRWIGRYRWITVLAVSILLPFAGYVVFEKWFLIPLPEGSLTSRFGF